LFDRKINQIQTFRIGQNFSKDVANFFLFRHVETDRGVVNFQIFVIQKIFDHKSGSANRIADCRKDECNGKTVSKPEEKLLICSRSHKTFFFFSNMFWYGLHHLAVFIFS
jgi:hypothetical protein